MKNNPFEAYSKTQLDSLVEQCSSGGGYEYWVKARKFIVKAINKDGTFLDIGCSNGFLLKCLQAWSPYTITPYGIDNRGDAMKQAKELFSDLSDHFELFDGNSLSEITHVGLPNKYDYVFRNHWKLDTTDSEMKKIFDDLILHVNSNGRIIVGLYWPNVHKKESEDYHRVRKHFLQYIDRLKSSSPHIDGESFSEIGDHWIMWIDTNS